MCLDDTPKKTRKTASLHLDALTAGWCSSPTACLQVIVDQLEDSVVVSAIVQQVFEASQVAAAGVDHQVPCPLLTRKAIAHPNLLQRIQQGGPAAEKVLLRGWWATCPVLCCCVIRGFDSGQQTS